MNTKKYRWLSLILCFALMFTSFGGATYAVSQNDKGTEVLMEGQASIAGLATVYEATTNVQELIGISSNDKTKAQFTWLDEAGNLMIAVISDHKSHPVEYIVFNNLLGDAPSILEAASADVSGSEEEELLVSVNGGAPESYYVGDYAQTNNADLRWMVFNLGSVEFAGTFQLELYTGAGGFNVVGESAEWYIVGSLTIFKELYDEYGDPITGGPFNIEIYKDGQYYTTVTINIDDADDNFELLLDLELGEYSATESAIGYVAEVSSPVTLTNKMRNAEITVTNRLEQNSSLEITKSVAESTYDSAGDILHYTIVVENTGSKPLTGIIFNDSLEGISTLEVVESLNEDLILDVGEKWTYTYSYTVSQQDIDSKRIIENIATVDTEQTEPQQSSCEVIVKQDSAMTVTKSANKSIYYQAGESILYTIKVENTGKVTITDVVVEDSKYVLPAPTGDAGTLGALEPGETWTYEVSYTVTQSDMDNGSIENTVTATSDSLKLSENDTVTITAYQYPSMTVTKSAIESTYYEAGDVIHYTIQIKNTGNVTLTDVVADDSKYVLPAQTGDAGTIGALEPGETWTYEVSYTVTQSDIDNGSIENTATATSDSWDLSESDTNTIKAYEIPVDGPQIKLIKSLDPSSATYSKAGDILDYVFTLENTGNVALYDVNINDPLVSVQGEPITLEPGESDSTTFTASYIITDEDIVTGSVTNVATATGYTSDQTEISSTDSAIAYAVYTITYVNGGRGTLVGEVDGQVINTGVRYGETTPTPPAIDGQDMYYYFAGWAPTVAANVTQSATYIAQWTYYRPGSGGGSTTIIDPDVPLALTTDHIAYIQGYPENMVRPEDNVTREEVAAVFFRLLESTYREMIRSSNSNFSDVGSARWSNKHIATLVNGEILQGYEDGTFKPGTAITRAELASIASRFDDLETTTSAVFSDINGHWAESYINSANAKGWINGYPDGTFKPNQFITRAEFVTLVNNVLQRKVKAEAILPEARQFPDLVKGSWYYEAMQEAINSHLYNTTDDGYEEWIEIIYPEIEM